MMTFLNGLKTDIIFGLLLRENMLPKTAQAGRTVLRFVHTTAILLRPATIAVQCA